MRELELERLRAKLRNKLKEQELSMNAGDKRNNHASVCYLSGNRTAEFRAPVSKCRPLINQVVNKSVEDDTTCDFEKENCDPLSKIEDGKGIKVYRISDCERKVRSIAGGENVRAVALGAQRVMNSGDIGVGSLELLVKSLTGPEALICEKNCKKKDTVMIRNTSKIVPFEKEREADLNAASDFSIENTDPFLPTQGDGTEPTIEFPAFVEKNEGEPAQLKNSDFSSKQNKCPDLHVLWEKAKLGLSECCRTREGNLERVTGTEKGDEFGKLGVPLKFTLEINQLSNPLSDSSGRVQGILKSVEKALCAEKKKLFVSAFALRMKIEVLAPPNG
ncbi:hypothetical protein TNCV_3267071 [Trichonephila clavipes]|nr:hypothetical protein TNCV_3267071 [Trichonephila clavipes]